MASKNAGKVDEIKWLTNGCVLITFSWTASRTGRI